MLRLGTKWPSITSTWMRSAPAASTSRTSSPSREKSAERMDGAIMGGSRFRGSESQVVLRRDLASATRKRETDKTWKLELETGNSSHELTTSRLPASCSRSPAGARRNWLRTASERVQLLDPHDRHSARRRGVAAVVLRAVVRRRCTGRAATSFNGSAIASKGTTSASSSRSRGCSACPWSPIAPQYQSTTAR